MHFSPVPCVLHIPSIQVSLDLITLIILIKSVNNEANQCANIFQLPINSSFLGSSFPFGYLSSDNFNLRSWQDMKVYNATNLTIFICIYYHY
jgi:tellurite resistance protein TehA-like permease